MQAGWNTSFTNSNIWAGIANKDSLDILMDTLQDGKLLEEYDVSALGDFIDNMEPVFTPLTLFICHLYYPLILLLLRKIC